MEDQSGSLTGQTSRGGSRRGAKWGIALGIVVVLAVLAILADLLFGAHHVGPRSVAIDGGGVMSADGFTVRSTTWIARPSAITLFGRIDVPTGPLEQLATRSRQGTAYVRAADVIAVLKRSGDSAQLVGNQLQVKLKPGQHYTYQAKAGDVRQQSIRVNGQPAAGGPVLGLTHNEAPYLPAAAVAKALAQGGLKSSWSGQALKIALVKQPPASGPQYLTGNARIEFGAGYAIEAPPFNWHGVDYLPVNSVTAALRQLGWTGSLASWQWSAQSAHPSGATAAAAATSGTAVTAAQTPLSMGFVPFYAGDLAAYQDVMAHRTAFNVMASDAWEVTAAGGLSGSAPAGTDSRAIAAGEPVYAMIANLGSSGFNSKLIAGVLADKTRSANLENAVTRLVESNGSAGAVLDFESIPASSRSAYTALVTQLAADLHRLGKQLWVVVPPDTGYSAENWNNAYDDAALGQAANGIVVMAYDYSYAGGKPGPIAPVPWVQSVLAYTVSQVPANKVLLGIDVYGYDWGSQSATAVSLTSVDSFLAAHHIAPKWDAGNQAPYFTWKDSSGVTHTVYYENRRSTEAKLTLADTYGIRGIAVWRPGLENAAVQGALTSYVQH